jgi:diguanylate cyclase (GGDEF)-like protein/PAS domain S-box-containing protein
LVENANDLIYCIDLQGNFTSFNRTAQRTSGYSRPEALRMNIAHLVAPEHLDAARQMMHKTLRGENARGDLEIVAKDGRRVLLEVSHRLLLHGGMPVGAHVIARDITNRRRMEALERDRLEILEMIATRQPLERILDQVVRMVERQDPDALGSVMLLRDNRLYTAASPRLPEAFVRSMDGLWTGPTSASCGAAAYWRRSIITGDIKKDTLWEEHREAAIAYGLRACWSVPILTATGHVLGTLAIYRRNPGRPKMVQIELLKNSARTASIAIEQRQLTDQLAHQAHHDALTGLPNRVLFQDRLNQAIASARRTDTSVGLLYIDLDRFKLINDTLGHPAGDRLLTEVARRLSGCIRETDTLARISGDEFTLIATGLKDHSGARRLADAILNALHDPFEMDGHELYATASIGISYYPKDAEDAETLLQNADNAMYRAKNGGKNRFEYFAPEMTTASAERLAVENYLRRALDRSEFVLYYQPQFELETGRQVGQEALLRWKHPKLGMVPPDKFIPAAEESGLIVPIGRWVLEESCRQAREWQREDKSIRSISVNVSAIQLARKDFIATVEAALASSGLEPRYLELELTESIVMSDMVEFAKKMAQLRGLGVRISVDDFGTGYSSLSYLQRLPIDILKLDRSFVEEFKHSSSGSSLVRAVVTLAHGLGIRVTAEGVETEQQLEAVQMSGCDKAQGYLLGRPAPADSIRPMMRPVAREMAQKAPAQMQLAR